MVAYVNPYTLLPLFIAGLCFLGSGHAGASDRLENRPMPSLITGIRFDSPLDFCGEPVPLEDPEIRERLEKEMLLALWDRAQVILWLKRSTRYFPVIEERLAQRGLPADLKYVAVVESALLPHAGSHRGAVGFWQFIRSTGKKYGLRIDRHIDERRNIFTSTTAALAYLENLYEMTGSWTLATAAYNMGESGLTAALDEQMVGDYYRLYLPLETQRYVFKVLAVKRILSQPRKFGFELEASDLYPPHRFDWQDVDIDRPTRIRTIARAAGTDYKRIKDLNPQIRGGYLPRGRYRLLLPEKAGRGFEQRLAQLVKKEAGAEKKEVYVVRRGDNLSLIASRFEVSLTSLLDWNRLSMNQPIHPGDRLVIYRK